MRVRFLSSCTGSMMRLIACTSGYAICATAARLPIIKSKTKILIREVIIIDTFSTGNISRSKESFEAFRDDNKYSSYPTYATRGFLHKSHVMLMIGLAVWDGDLDSGMYL